jgi:hypothetical protein
MAVLVEMMGTAVAANKPPTHGLFDEFDCLLTALFTRNTCLQPVQQTVALAPRERAQVLKEALELPCLHGGLQQIGILVGPQPFKNIQHLTRTAPFFSPGAVPCGVQTPCRPRFPSHFDKIRYLDDKAVKSRTILALKSRSNLPLRKYTSGAEDGRQRARGRHLRHELGNAPDKALPADEVLEVSRCLDQCNAASTRTPK